MIEQHRLPATMWAVFVRGTVIALFGDELEAVTYMRLMRGPESVLERVGWGELRVIAP
jgi:hypothetical protein